MLVFENISLLCGVVRLHTTYHISIIIKEYSVIEQHVMATHTKKKTQYLFSPSESNYDEGKKTHTSTSKSR